MFLTNKPGLYEENTQYLPLDMAVAHQNTVHLCESFDMYLKRAPVSESIYYMIFQIIYSQMCIGNWKYQCNIGLNDSKCWVVLLS